MFEKLKGLQMSTTKLRFWIEAVEKDGELEILVKKVKKEQEDIWFCFDERNQTRGKHTDLFNLNIIKNNIKGITKIGQKRRVLVEATKELAQTYLDNTGMFRFNSQILEEDDKDDDHTIPRDYQKELFQLLKVLTKRLNKDDTKKLNLTKYDGKEDAKLFLTQFEKEVNSFDLDDDKKIEVFGNYLTGTAKKWYSKVAVVVVGRKFQDEDWFTWKESFMAVFGVKNWAAIANAFQYKYMGGSLIDYAITKEKMLRDTNEAIDDITIINQIMINTPQYIQEQIKPGRVDTLNTLFEELSTIKLRADKDHPQDKQNQRSVSAKVQPSKSYGNPRPLIKKACPICERLGYKGRYHPEDLCRNKSKIKNTVTTNIIESHNTDETSSEDESISKN
ncbi:hypothetical protein O3M35_009895 [Rhynocoris fuscipes]|uniref:Retrotransposon gag domain-containing protein n=1 Tax=Rhynocoris fuscipes TaxID=488301 RepID=A0AAW1D6Z3_9HEMI